MAPKPKLMTSEQAFLQIINNDEYRLSLPLNEQKNLASYKSQYSAGKLNLDRIDNFLKKHGYKVAQERLWSKKEK
jgi:hypothetical protein